MARSLIASKMRVYLFTTLAAPVFMLLGAVALIACVVYLLMGKGDDLVIQVMLFINGSLMVFGVGCALVVYRSAVLTDIARELHANGDRGMATIMQADYSGAVEAEHHKQWYELKLAVQPDDVAAAPFTVDIEQLFNVEAKPWLKAGSVVSVRFSPDSDIFALVWHEAAYERLK